ncbi:two-component system, cell cycle response regulator [Gammaproteobacteria bacterium]
MVIDALETILIVEDSPVQAIFLKRLLQERGYQVRIAHDGWEGMQQTQTLHPDLVITDVKMPVMNGFEMCRTIKDTPEIRKIPVLLLTELADSQDIIHGLKAGADNYLTKPFDHPLLLNRVAQLLEQPAASEVEATFEVLFQGIRYHITTSPRRILNLLLTTYESAVAKNTELLRAQEVQRDLNAKLEKMAFYDPLTNLPNRRLFFDRLEQTLALSQRYERTFALLSMDLDGFKGVNDQFGHDAGDLLLIEVAHRLLEEARDSDTVARLGGDEFMMILPSTHQEGACHLAKRLIEKLGRPYKILGQTCEIGVSVGIVLFPEDSRDKETLLKYADMALYRAKAGQRGTCQLFAGEPGALDNPG